MYNFMCAPLFQIASLLTIAVLLFLALMYILDKLFWPITPFLEAVGQHEPQVDTLRERLILLIRQSIIPLEQYAEQYACHLDLINLDIKGFIQ